MCTARKFVHINAYPEVFLAILLNDVTSAKKLLTAAPRTCVSLISSFFLKHISQVRYHSKCSHCGDLVYRIGASLRCWYFCYLECFKCGA